MEQYSNKVAEKVDELCKIVKISAIIILVITSIVAIVFKTLTLFIIGLVGITFLIMWSYSLMAKAEIIQKLHNIENNTKKQK